MRVQAQFNDEREKNVNSKDKVPTLDMDLHLDSGEQRDVTLPAAEDGTRYLMVDNNLTLPDGVYTTEVQLRAASVIHKLTVAPGNGQAVPVADTVTTLRVTSNSDVVGTVRITVLQ